MPPVVAAAAAKASPRPHRLSGVALFLVVPVALLLLPAGPIRLDRLRFPTIARVPLIVVEPRPLAPPRLQEK